MPLHFAADIGKGYYAGRTGELHRLPPQSFGLHIVHLLCVCDSLPQLGENMKKPPAKSRRQKERGYFLKREMPLSTMELQVSTHSSTEVLGTTSISADQSCLATHAALCA